jgi:hypothetical protein
MKGMHMPKNDNENLKSKIYDLLIDLIPSSDDAANATSKIMKLVDKHVESQVIDARLEVMKNFKAI